MAEPHRPTGDEMIGTQFGGGLLGRADVQQVGAGTRQGVAVAAETHSAGHHYLVASGFQEVRPVKGVAGVVGIDQKGTHGFERRRQPVEQLRCGQTGDTGAAGAGVAPAAVQRGAAHACAGI